MPTNKILSVLALISAMVTLAAVAAKSEPAIKGTISVGKVAIKDFPRLAKISMANAVAAAKEKVPGKDLSSNLEAEDGFLVFSVEIQKKSSEIVEVVVDAGSGSVLATNKEDTHEDKEERENE